MPDGRLTQSPAELSVLRIIQKLGMTGSKMPFKVHMTTRGLFYLGHAKTLWREMHNAVFLEMVPDEERDEEGPGGVPSFDSDDAEHATPSTLQTDSGHSFYLHRQSEADNCAIAPWSLQSQDS